MIDLAPKLVCPVCGYVYGILKDDPQVSQAVTDFVTQHLADNPTHGVVTWYVPDPVQSP